MASGTAVRILTAAILIPLVVAAIWWGPTWLVAALAAGVAILALLEFLALGERMGFHPSRGWTCLAAAGIFLQQWYASQSASVSHLGNLAYDPSAPRLNLELILLVYVLGLAIITLGSARPVSEVVGAISIGSAGLVIVVLPFSAVVRLDGVDAVGPQLLLFTLVLVWAGDTAAYFVGRNFGRNKIAPVLSPKKTWEGAVGNVLASLLVGGLFAYWIGASLAQMLVMALLGSIAGQVGDIFESSFKRAAGVKDSGTILPGHGGMLDRVDALILAAPVVWYYFQWVAARTKGF